MNQPQVSGPFGKISRSSLYAFQLVYKEQTLSHPTVSLRHKRCIEGRENVENDSSCGIIFAQTLRIPRSSVITCQVLFWINPSSSEISRTVNRRSPHTIFFTSSTLLLFLLVEGLPHLGSSSTSSHPSLNLSYQRRYVREKLLNETKSALCRLVQAYKELLKEIFPNGLEIRGWFVALLSLQNRQAKT